MTADALLAAIWEAPHDDLPRLAYADFLDDTGGPAEVARAGLELLEVDECGLDRSDRRLLRTLAQHYGGGPVGLETLAAAIGEEAETIEDVYEPYLMQQGFLQRTPRGRVATRLAGEHLGLPMPAAGGSPGKGGSPAKGVSPGQAMAQADLFSEPSEPREG